MMTHTSKSPETRPATARPRLDLLHREIVNLYSSYIERMSATEIVRAHAQSHNQPAWREALEIYGPRRIERLVQYGDISAVEVAKALN